MSFYAILLLLIAAVLHTIWNVLLKQAGEKYIATWWSVLLGSSLFLPVLFFMGPPKSSVWLMLFFSVLVEIAYYIILSTAYRDADFSMVYPLARGAAPALLATWSFVFLGEKLSPKGILGLAVIIAGLLIVGGSHLFASRRDKPHLHGIALAFLLSLLISIYSAIDGAAVKLTPPLPYGVLIFFFPPLLTTPLMFRHFGWQALKSELKLHWVRMISIGLLMVTAYLLGLMAYAVSPVSYTGAIREVSVVMGALAGWLFLKERMGGWRLAGALVIFSGILVIALWG